MNPDGVKMPPNTNVPPINNWKETIVGEQYISAPACDISDILGHFEKQNVK